MRVILTDDEKECLKPCVDKLQTAEEAFERSSEMMKQSRRKMWERVHEIHPEGTTFDCPPDGDWWIDICNPVVVDTDTSGKDDANST